MSAIKVGTASWTDPTLIQCRRFYPKGCTSAEARLAHYASEFPLVEVNSSYYALPTPRNAELWAERTPVDFKFNVKAFRLFTGHQTPLEALPKPVRTALPSQPKNTIYYRNVPHPLRDTLWQYFVDAIEPLHLAGKLGAVHFQFAPWVRYDERNLAHIVECRERLARYTLSIEFRHESWFAGDRREETLAFESAHGLVNAVVDEPQGFANTVPAVWRVTNPRLAVVRLHGRNSATWNIKGQDASSARFNYDYPKAELAELAVDIQEIAKAVDKTHVLFNNNYEDQGPRNAKALMNLLGD